MTTMNVLDSSYEAGFLLFYNEHFIMSLPESDSGLQYFGGKEKPEDNNDPLKTAYNELAEKVGQQILEDDWKTRIIPLHKNKIYSYLLKLTKTEYHKLVSVDQNAWLITDSKDLSHITGRNYPVNKTVSAFIILCTYHFVNHLEDCSKNNNYNNNKVRARLVPTGEMYEYNMDKHTTEIFKEHAKIISQEINSNRFNLANFLNIKEIMCFTTQ